MNVYLSSPSTSFNYLSNSYLYSNIQLEPKDHIKRLRIFSKVFLSISIFFWIWAVYISKYKMKSKFDMGAVSFLLSGLSSLYLYLKTKKGIDDFTSTGILGRAFVTFTHLVVSLHHLLGVYMAITIGEGIYVQYATFCVGFTILWLVSARIGWTLITNTIEYGLDDDYDDDDDEETSYDEEEGDFLDDYDLSPRIDLDDTISRRPYS